MHMVLCDMCCLGDVGACASGPMYAWLAIWDHCMAFPLQMVYGGIGKMGSEYLKVSKPSNPNSDGMLCKAYTVKTEHLCSSDLP